MYELRIDRRFIPGFRDECAIVVDKRNIEQTGAYDKRVFDGDLS